MSSPRCAARTPRPAAGTTDEEDAGSATPSETTLKLTVPEMERVSDVTVLDAPFDDESALEDGAQHVEGTGFPWEDEANVFIAGHRLGYFGTDSYLVFWDLDKLEDGDEVFLTDSDGTRYTYEVYENFVTDPYDWSVAEPVSGKNIVTLQTCTLPDYSERIIVQAELTEVEPGEGVAPEEDEPERDEPSQYEPEPVSAGFSCARMALRICCEPAAISRASELTVTNWKPLSIILSAYSGAVLWMPATTPCARARARM